MHIPKKSYNLLVIDYITAVIAWVLFFYFRKYEKPPGISLYEVLIELFIFFNELL